jgi:hypothetical protein
MVEPWADLERTMRGPYSSQTKVILKLSCGYPPVILQSSIPFPLFVQGYSLICGLKMGHSSTIIIDY